ncbi:MAG: hypothetical protein LUG13_08695 [Oscillospiraceae bacterium]|nr:hypothetical protein [Oscillospiraceae bacterium]
MNQQRVTPGWKYFVAALIGAALLIVGGAAAPTLLENLWYSNGKEVAVSIIQGEYYGLVCRQVLYAGAPVFVVVCFFVEQMNRWQANKKDDHETPPEFDTQAEHEAFYLAQLKRKRERSATVPWIAYLVLCGLTIMFCSFYVITTNLTDDIAELRADMEDYRAGEPAVYVGVLRQVERPIKNGFKAIADPRYRRGSRRAPCTRRILALWRFAGADL